MVDLFVCICFFVFCFFCMLMTDSDEPDAPIQKTVSIELSFHVYFNVLHILSKQSPAAPVKQPETTVSRDGDGKEGYLDLFLEYAGHDLDDSMEIPLQKMVRDTTMFFHHRFNSLHVLTLFCCQNDALVAREVSETDANLISSELVSSNGGISFEKFVKGISSGLVPRPHQKPRSILSILEQYQAEGALPTITSVTKALVKAVSKFGNVNTSKRSPILV
jgi:hypothetical protein